MAFRSLVPFGFGSPGMPMRRAQDPFWSLRRDMERLFDEFFRGPGTTDGDGIGMAPSIDVCETDKELQIVAELPGVDEKDIDVQLSGDMLTIKGEKKSDQQRSDKNYHLVERSYGSFARSIQMPFTADSSKVQASFDKGVLTITVPKPAEAQQSAKRIEIKKGASGAGSGQSAGA